MTTEEFSNEFDTLVSSYRRFKSYDDKEYLDSIEFDEYEKSVFLTQAQEDIVLELYNGKNQTGESFEESEQSRRFLSPLLATESIGPMQEKPISISSKSQFFQLPDDLLFITYESAYLEYSSLVCQEEEAIAMVIPVKQDEYHRIRNNPFRGKSSKRVLRLDYSESVVELVSDYNIKTYIIKYIKKPQPIILTNLPNGISINNITTVTQCQLNPLIHRTILERAVRLALNSKIITKDN